MAKKMKTAPAPPAPPEPSYPQSSDLSPEEYQAMLDAGYFDAGDGELIPPMEDNPYSTPKPGKQAQPGMQRGTYDVPGWATANPKFGANAAGGPGGGSQDAIRSDIFKQLYKSGKQSGNEALMNIGKPPMEPRPPLEMPVPPWEQPAEEPFYLEAPKSAAPPPRDQWPVHLQNPGYQSPQQGGTAMLDRFPRAASLMSGNRMPPRQRGR